MPTLVSTWRGPGSPGNPLGWFLPALLPFNAIFQFLCLFLLPGSHFSPRPGVSLEAEGRLPLAKLDN